MLHYLYFISDILVVSYVQSCAYCLPKATAIAPIAPLRSLHGDRTALPYHTKCVGSRIRAGVVRGDTQRPLEHCSSFMLAIHGVFYWLSFRPKGCRSGYELFLACREC